MNQLNGRVAIVTGGVQGIGLGVSLCLARAGANVVLAELVKENILAASAKIEETGVQVLGVQTDVTDASSVDHLVRATMERFGRIDILVNNAGVVNANHISKQTEADYDAVLDVNLIVALTRDLAVEVGQLGIRVNAIAPGSIETPGNRLSQIATGESDQERADRIKSIPLGRIGQPRDIGDAVVFLASDAAGYISGVTLPVTGGR